MATKTYVGKKEKNSKAEKTLKQLLKVGWKICDVAYVLERDAEIFNEDMGEVENVTETATIDAKDGHVTVML